MKKKSIIKEIDTSTLPKKGKLGRIDWANSVGCKVNFKYDDIEDTITIVENLGNKNIKIQYKDNIKILNHDKFIKLQIGDLLGKRMHEFRYQIGDIVTNIIGLTGKIMNCYMNKNFKYYDIECPKCGNIFSKSEPLLLSYKSWCPLCDNDRTSQVFIGYNDIWTIRPDLAEQLWNPDDGYKYTYGTDKKLKWKCSSCGKPYDTLATPYTISHYHHGFVTCKRCSYNYSYPNRFIFNILESLNVKFKTEYIFSWCNNRRYDFFLYENNIIIEAMGRQHYESSAFTMSLEKITNNDQFKKEIAIENGISEDNYLMIDCRKSDPDYIMDNLKKSKLGSIYDLNSINIYEINKKTCGNTINMICNYIVDGFSIAQIAKKMHMNWVTVNSYVNTIEELGLCSYDKNKFIHQSRFKKGHSSLGINNKPIICVEYGYTFNCLSEASRQGYSLLNCNIDISGISRSIKNNTTYKGYHWKYITKEEFNKIKLETPEKAFGDLFELEEKAS